MKPKRNGIAAVMAGGFHSNLKPKPAPVPEPEYMLSESWDAATRSWVEIRTPIVKPPVNAHEQLARLEKAIRLADFLQYKVHVANVAEVRRMSEEDWELLGAALKYKTVPSLLTREKVCELLEKRERITGLGMRLDPVMPVEVEEL